MIKIADKPWQIIGLGPATLLRKKTLAQVFSCEFCEIYKDTFFTEHLRTTTSATSWKIDKRSCFIKF